MAKRSQKRARQDERRRQKEEAELAALAAEHKLSEELDRLFDAPSTDVIWRTDCDNYRSRTMATGDVVAACRVDAAGPFGCPTDCPSFEGRGSQGAGAR